MPKGMLVFLLLLLSRLCEYCSVYKITNRKQTLRSDKHIDPATGEENDQTATIARLNLADVLYEQFRSSTDPQRKIALLNEMRQMQETRTRGPLQGWDTYESSTGVIHALMVRKSGLPKSIAI